MKYLIFIFALVLGLSPFNVAAYTEAEVREMTQAQFGDAINEWILQEGYPPIDDSLNANETILAKKLNWYQLELGVTLPELLSQLLDGKPALQHNSVRLLVDPANTMNDIIKRNRGWPNFRDQDNFFFAYWVEEMGGKEAVFVEFADYEVRKIPNIQYSLDPDLLEGFHDLKRDGQAVISSEWLNAKAKRGRKSLVAAEIRSVYDWIVNNDRVPLATATGEEGKIAALLDGFGGLNDFVQRIPLAMAESDRLQLAIVRQSPAAFALLNLRIKPFFVMTTSGNSTLAEKEFTTAVQALKNRAPVMEVLGPDQWARVLTIDQFYGLEAIIKWLQENPIDENFKGIPRELWQPHQDNWKRFSFLYENFLPETLKQNKWLKNRSNQFVSLVDWMRLNPDIGFPRKSATDPYERRLYNWTTGQIEEIFERLPADLKALRSVRAKFKSFEIVDWIMRTGMRHNANGVLSWPRTVPSASRKRLGLAGKELEDAKTQTAYDAWIRKFGGREKFFAAYLANETGVSTEQKALLRFDWESGRVLAEFMQANGDKFPDSKAEGRLGQKLGKWIKSRGGPAVAFAYLPEAYQNEIGSKIDLIAESDIEAEVRLIEEFRETHGRDPDPFASGKPDPSVERRRGGFLNYLRRHRSDELRSVVERLASNINIRAFSAFCSEN